MQNKGKEQSIMLNNNESYIHLEEELVFKSILELKNISFNRYPDENAEKLKSEYAKYANIDCSNIIVCNGNYEILDLILRSNLVNGKRILTLNPDCAIEDGYCINNKFNCIRFKSDEDGDFDISKFIIFGMKKDIDLVVISNPNNPTGNNISNEDIVKILKSFRRSIVLIDESYFEFSLDTCISLIGEYENLLITRTLSNGWGLAGIKIDFLIGNIETIEKLKNNTIIKSVNSLSQSVATRILSNSNDMKSKFQEIIKQRDIFYYKLKDIEDESSLEIKFYKSRGNYIYGRSPYKNVLLKAMYNKGIIIKSFDDDSFRITVGSKLQNEKVIEALKKSFVY